MNGRKRIIVIMIILFGLLMTTGVSTWIITSQVTFAPEPINTIVVTPSLANIDVTFDDLTNDRTYKGFNDVVAAKTKKNALTFSGTGDTAFEYDTHYTYKVDILYDGTNYATLPTNSTKTAIGSTYKYQITIELKDSYKSIYTLTTSTLTAIIKYQTCQIGSDWYTIEDALASGSSITNAVITTAGSSETTKAQTAFSRLNDTGETLASIKNKLSDSSVLNNYSTNYTYELASSNTLYVPHDTDAYSEDNICDNVESYGVTAGNNVYSSLLIPSKITLNINSNSTLAVGAVVYIAGEVGVRGVIINNGTINAKSTSNISVYGYLKGNRGDKTIDKGLVLESGATATEIFRIYDFSGGSITTDLNGDDIFPINLYTLHNISCYTTMKSGSTYNVYYYMVMSSMTVDGTVSLVGNSRALFSLNSGEIVKTTEFTKPSENNDISATNSRPKTQRDKLYLYGVVYDSKVSISKSIYTIESSTAMAMPLGFFDIVICSGGELTLSAASYKIYPGSTIIIENGGKLTVGDGSSAANLQLLSRSVYDTCFSVSKSCQQPSSDGTSYKVSSTDDACIINNGELTINTKAGICGKVSTSNDGSIFNLLGNNTSSIKYSTEYSTGLTDIGGGETATINNIPTTGDVLYTSQTLGTNVTENQNLASATTYKGISKSESTYAWIADKSITVTVNMGSASIPLNGNSVTGVVVNESDFIDKIPENYKIDGDTLHFDDGRTGNYPYIIGESVIHSSVTLYVKTIYTSGYLIDFVLGTDGTGVDDIEIQDTDAWGGLNLSNVIPTRQYYTFKGWVDANNNDITNTTITKETFGENFTITITAVWNPTITIIGNTANFTISGITNGVNFEPNSTITITLETKGNGGTVSDSQLWSSVKGNTYYDFSGVSINNTPITLNGANNVGGLSISSSFVAADNTVKANAFGTSDNKTAPATMTIIITIPDNYTESIIINVTTS